MSSQRRSKRARTQPDPPKAGPKPGPTPLKDADFPSMEFRDEEQYSRFQCLKKRRIIPTRFYSEECTTELGIKSDLQWLFHRVGWSRLMTHLHFTFHELTLEFLSSFQQNTVKVPRGEYPGVKFRILNQEFSKTIDEFGDFFGLPRGGSVVFYNSDPNMVWKGVSGCNDYNPQSSKASRINNPVFRYLQRLMANTIFGRHDSQGTVREWEMEMLQSMLYPPQVPVSTASYIARHFYAVGKSKKKSPIVVGGLITPIAVALGFDFDSVRPVGAIPMLDVPKLVTMGWLHQDGDRFRWVVNKRPTFFLPNVKRTTIRNQANWELSGAFSSDEENEDEEQNVVDEGNCDQQFTTSPPPLSFRYDGHVGGSSSSPPFPQPPPQCGNGDFDVLLSSLNSILTGVRDIQASQRYMNQRLDQFDQMIYPIYNWHVKQGHIDPNTLPYPDPNYPQPQYPPPDPPAF